jgi:Domain of unknown function (DUF4168)
MGQRTVNIWVQTLSAIALSCGLVSSCSRSLPNNPPDPARDTSTLGSNTAYARSVLSLEPLRQKAYEQIKAAESNSSQPPAILCNDRRTVVALPRTAKKIVVNYCNEAKTIVEKNGLTPKQFNEITQEIDKDPQLKEAIKKELIKLQQPTQPAS